MSNNANVLVVGYGEMGHAMQHLLGKRHRLTFYDSRPIEGLPEIDVEEAAGTADFIIFCIPANPLEEMLVKIGPRLGPDTVCISISKGLDDRGRTPAEVYRQIFGSRHRYGLLYGPMISEEICVGRTAFADLGCSEAGGFQEVGALFEGSALHIRQCDDIAGISWSVILKNVYAIAFGIADALQLGDNVRGFLTVTAMQEICSIIEVMGGRSSTAFRLAGLGDLITTATSAGSHHHELGTRLARGEVEGITGEGIHTLAMVDKFRLIDTSYYPLFSLIRAVVHSPRSTEKRFSTYLSNGYCYES